MKESSSISSKREIKAPIVREYLDQAGENLHKILKESISDFPGSEMDSFNILWRFSPAWSRYSRTIGALISRFEDFLQ
jgi:hypothetical protein